MLQNLICPHCRWTVAVPDDLLGGTAACPHCRGVFVAPAPAVVPEPPPAPVPFSFGSREVDEEGSRPPRRESSASAAGEPKPGWITGIGAVFLLGSLGLLAWQLPWVQAVLRGPRPVTEAELAKLGPGSRADYISYTAPEVKETGVGITSGRRGLKSRYLLVRVGKEWMIADVAADHTGNRLAGHVTSFNSSSIALDKQAHDAIRRDHPDLPLAPYYFYAAMDETRQVYAFLAVVAAAVPGGAALTGWGLVLMNRRPGGRGGYRRR